MAEIMDIRDDTAKDTSSSKAASPTASMKRVVLAGGIGTVIEFFDFGIYSFLATILAANFFPKQDPTAGLIATFAVFGVAYVVRPLGGIWLSHLGDRVGRRFVLALSVTMMATATALIGLLPTYASIGLWAPVLLVLLRCFQGVSAGGEVGAAITYIAEVSPNNRRGFLTSSPQVGTVAGTMLASLAVVIVSITLTREQMLDWGWRIPFLVSFPLGMFGLIVRYRLEESKQFERVQKAGKIERVPFITAVTQYPRGILTVFCMSLVSFASYYLTFTYLSTYFQQQGWMSVSTATWSTTVSTFLAAVGVPFWAALSDRIGRKPILIGACLCNLLLAYPAFLLMPYSPVVAIAVQILMGQFSAAYFSVNVTVYCELFPDRVRLSALSLGHNLSVMVAGGMAPLIATYLIARTGNIASPSWFLCGAAFISLMALLSIKETAGKPLPSSV